MIPFILGAIGLIAYGLSEKETEQNSSKKSYSKGLPAKIKWDKKNNIYGKSVGSKFLKISKSEFDSLYNDAHEGYYYQANAQLKGGVMTYTLRSIHSKTKMAKGGGVSKGDIKNRYFLQFQYGMTQALSQKVDKILYKYSKEKYVLAYIDYESQKSDNIWYMKVQGLTKDKAISLAEELKKLKILNIRITLSENRYAKGGRIGQSGYAIMVDGKLRTDAYRRVEFFATIEKALFKLSHVPFYKPLSKEEKLKLIVPYTIPKMGQGGNISSEINALYEKSNLINDDFDWKNKLLEMLQDNSVEAYNIYQKLTAKQKKDVLEELFEMDNDMGSYGDEDIATSKENLSILLSDAKKGKKY